MPDGANEPRAEREFETGKDEAWSVNMKALFDAWFANMKRTYDEYQHESLESIRYNRSYVAKVLSDAQQNDNTRQNIANQALQNAVETANLVGKQAVRHAELAIDRQWNVNETDALATALAAKISDNLKAK